MFAVVACVVGFVLSHSTLYETHTVRHQKPSKVFLLGVSGLSSTVLQSARTPNIDWLRRNGAWTFEARSQTPSNSMSNWASVLTGTAPAYHGVFDEDWTM